MSTYGGLNAIAEAAFTNSEAHGFWADAPVSGSSEEPTYLAAKIALIHSEVSEALEDIRKGALLAGLVYPPVPASLAVEFPSGADATEVWQSRTQGKPTGLPSELADIIIRVGDLATYLGIDLETAVQIKMAYNITRPFKHGKAL